MFGWVQLVRSTDNASQGEEFEIDPFALFDDVRTPYCWYGTEPTLFDSPCRVDRASPCRPYRANMYAWDDDCELLRNS
jgi:hypothetical protein